MSNLLALAFLKAAIIGVLLGLIFIGIFALGGCEQATNKHIHTELRD